jgi:hypothetical protein
MPRSRSACALAASIAIALPVARFARAADVTPEERAFIESHQKEIVKIEPTKLADPSLPTAFAVPFFLLTVSTYTNGGVGTEQFIVTRLGNDLVSVGDPGTDDPAPVLGKLLNPALRLRTDQDAIVLQRALDVVLPIPTDTERKAETFHHVGSEWKFVRNHFFGSESGYVFSTGPNGAVTSVKFFLKIP